MPDQTTIRELLQTFQEGYTHRDLAQVDAFMELFTKSQKLKEYPKTGARASLSKPVIY